MADVQLGLDLQREPDLRPVQLVALGLGAGTGLLVGTLPVTLGVAIDNGRGTSTILAGVVLALAGVFGGLAFAVGHGLAERYASVQRVGMIAACQLPPAAQQALRLALPGQLAASIAAGRRRALTPPLLAAAGGAGAAAIVSLTRISIPAAVTGAAVFTIAAAIAAITDTWSAPQADAELAASLLASLAATPASLTDPGFAAAAASALDRRVETGLSAARARARLLITLAVLAGAANALLAATTNLGRPGSRSVILLGEVTVLATVGYLAGTTRRTRHDAAGGRPRPVPARTTAPFRLAGGISFRRITVTANGQVLLAGIDLDVAPGERIGLLVPRGPAPLAMAALVAGLLRPDDGLVLYDGRTRDPRDLWSHIALISPHVTSVPGTVRQNLTLGDAVPTDLGRVREVTEISGLDEIIDRMPDGLDTPIGSRWWQPDELCRLAVARALLIDPAVVVVYAVPTEPPPETVTLNGIEALAAGRTTISIVTDPEPLRFTDLVFVLDRAGHIRTTTFAELPA